ncbi:hypothetical protein PR048_005451 [Dryococelus australis]|uniref:Transposase n=1 Tax=Dryococelus australis TaxID=614101 RepID=A0ABQ9I9E3_9NEOP|nr:hypothetical protein PR048_005451 [Dryococelus australis]
MDRAKIAAVCLYYCSTKKKYCDRLPWVYPINERREQVGLFNTLFEDFRNDESKFLSTIFAFALHLMIRMFFNMRNCTQPAGMSVVALRYLARGCTFTDLHYTYRIGVSTARKIVRDVCKAIWLVVRSECIPTPTK